MQELTRILNALDAGGSASTDDLLPLLYEELHKLARQRLTAAEAARQAADNARAKAEAAERTAQAARAEAEAARLQIQVRELNSQAVLYMNQHRHEQARNALFEAIALQPRDWGSLAILEKLPNYFLLKHALVPDSQHDPATWRYTFTPPAEDWTEPDFDDSDWAVGLAGFGQGDPYLPRTVWDTHDIWIRREFNLDTLPTGDWAFRVNNDDAAEVHLNGTLAAINKLWSREDYEIVPCRPEARAALKTGRNVLAAHGHNHLLGGFLDVGIHLVNAPETRQKWVTDTLTYLMTAHPEKGFIRRARGAWFARHGNLAAARDDLTTLLATDPDDHYDWFQSAPLFLLLHDREGYRRHQAEMLARFPPTEPPYIAERIAKAALLTRPSEEELPQVEALVQRALSVGDRNWLTGFAEATAALDAHRRDNPRQALALVTRSLAHRPEPENLYLTISCHLLAAMAHQELGAQVKARLSLDEARNLIEAHLPTGPTADHGSYWHDWLMCRLLIEEASAQVEGVGAPSPSSVRTGP